MLMSCKKFLFFFSSQGFHNNTIHRLVCTLQVADGLSKKGGPKADCAAGGLDPDPGEAGDPADPAGPLLG